MDQSAIPEEIEWGELPWFNSDREFTKQEMDEIHIYQKQDKFIAPRKQRRAAFDRRLQEMELEFEMAETHFNENIVNPFAFKVWVSLSSCSRLDS